MKITSYKLVDGITLIEQYLKSGFEPYGNPHIEVNGRVLQVMVFYEVPVVEPKVVEPKVTKSK